MPASRLSQQRHRPNIGTPQAERGYPQVGSGSWETDAELHRQPATGLHTALGTRYHQLVAEAQDVNLDKVIAQLPRSEPRDH